MPRYHFDEQHLDEMVICSLEEDTPEKHSRIICVKSPLSQRTKMGVSACIFWGACVFLVVCVMQVTPPTFLWKKVAAAERPALGPYETVENNISYTSDEGLLTARVVTSNALLWSTTVAGKGIWGKPLIWGGILYINVENGSVAALRAHDGSLLWISFLPSVYGSILRLDKGRVVVRFQRNRSYEGEIAVLQATSGMLLWHVPTFRFAHFIEENGIAYILTADGLLEARKVRDGRFLWSYQAQGQISLHIEYGVVSLSRELEGGVIKLCARDNTPLPPTHLGGSYCTKVE